MYVYNWVTLLYSWNTINQLYFNWKKKKQAVYLIGWINDFLSTHFVRNDFTESDLSLSSLSANCEGDMPKLTVRPPCGLQWLSFVMPPRGVFKNKITGENFNHKGRFCGVTPAFLNLSLLRPVAGHFSVVEAVSCIVGYLATSTLDAKRSILSYNTLSLQTLPDSPGSSWGKSHFWLKNHWVKQTNNNKKRLTDQLCPGKLILKSPNTLCYCFSICVINFYFG